MKEQHATRPHKAPLQRIHAVIQVDTREQLPLPVQGYEIERIGLPVGDYGIKGFSDWSNPAFIVERKSLNDLVGSLTGDRERFLREVEKLRAFRFRGLLIEAHRLEVEMGEFIGSASPRSLMATLDALEVRTGLHVMWAGDHHGAARRLEGLVRQFARGILKDARTLGVRCDIEERVG